jgi:F0F1-type ATP synthase assembly protein I
MSTATKAFLALSWVAAGGAAVLLGYFLDMFSLFVPGFLLMFLGLGVALHVEQVRHCGGSESMKGVEEADGRLPE